MNYVEILLQTKKGDFLPPAQQLLRQDKEIFVEHNSTRYFNVILGSNNIALVCLDGEKRETERELPELYSNKNNCCGCTACRTICPMSNKEGDIFTHYQFLADEKNDTYDSYQITGAISMLPDEEGFIYPVIDALKCIRCYKCINVCPYQCH